MKTRLIRGLAAPIFGALLVAGCTDAPEAPAGAGRLPAVLQIQPTFPPQLLQSAAALDALSEAFAKVDRFRMTVRRLSGEVVFDEVIEVTPGAASHELSASVPVQGATEQFLVDLIALQGGTELFRSENVQVRAVSGTVSETAEVSSAELRYVGPGAEAEELILDPTAVVLSPGTALSISVQVLDAEENLLTGVPIGWEVNDESVAAVEDGTVQASASGHVLVTATTPNGVSAEARLYVVDGDIAFTRAGNVFEGPVAGGSSTEVGAGGQAAYSPDGSRLFYAAGARVFEAGVGFLMSGLWPSVSPDGTKLAAEHSGSVRFANIDGTDVTEGPEGQGPQWLTGESFLVNAGGVDRVDYDGSDRSAVVSGEAGRPILGGDRLAYLSGGELFVAAEDGSSPTPIMTGAVGRPALSPDGEWVVATGLNGLVIAPTDGTGPALPLQHGASSQPAWRGAAKSAPPTPLQVTGLSPELPLVGDEVEILGTGFDALIPANNEVTFTTEGGGAVSGETALIKTSTPITGVTPTSLTTVIPEGVVPGPIGVSNFLSSTEFTFDPPLSTVTVSVKTTSGSPVPGVSVTLTDADGNEATAETDAEGNAVFDGLSPSEYSTSLEVPEGFTVSETPDPVEVAFGQNIGLEALLHANVVSVSVTPASPQLEVGLVTDVTVNAHDALGNPVTDPTSVSWSALTPARARHVGGQLTGRILGVLPSPDAVTKDARFRVTVEGVSAEFESNVKTFVGGIVSDGSGQPFPGITVNLFSNGVALGSRVTDAEGRYRFGGLTPGDYTVVSVPPLGFRDDPPEHNFTLDDATPAGIGNFVISLPDAFVLIPETVEKLPGGTQQFTPEGNTGPFDWTVNGVVGGDPTFGTITSEGFYTAPPAVPNPATFQVCAVVQGNSAIRACSEVTIEPIPTAGEDVVVFNDLNIFDNGALSLEPQNETLVANLVNYTADGTRAQNGTHVWWDLGHVPSCSSSTCAADGGNMTTAVSVIEGLGFTVVPKSSAVGDLATIPPEVKILWLWMPTVAYTVDEINAFKKFASEGGRIIFVGEHGGFYPEFEIENKFLEDMGAQMTNVGAFINCGRNVLPDSQIEDHQVTAGMTSAAMGCASEVVPGPNDFVLFRAGPSDLPIAGVAKIDVTPLPAAAPSMVIAPNSVKSVKKEKTHDALGNPIGNQEKR